METQQAINYQRIAEAISYLKKKFREQPSLDHAAEQINLSPFYFQRLFKEWAGVTPKQFLDYLTIDHARKILKEQRATLAEAAYASGLSGTGRLHDLFVKVDGMTPGEFKNGGQALMIKYSFVDTPFGEAIIASTPKGICYLVFADAGQETAFSNLQAKFPNARFVEEADAMQAAALAVFRHGGEEPGLVRLHLKGTPFQLKVWEALLNVPAGQLATYSSIASKTDNPAAFRAVGTAIGNNPVAFLIPCHRVIKATGELGNYHWGSARKETIIGWESARVYAEQAVEPDHP
jgi:AraC family transcriptional regulator of adaptative response/methylated-DNA-[protein]-cysteine methyltransferase